MNIFKKKLKEVKTTSPKETLQDYQSKIQTKLLVIGDVYYQKNVITKQLQDLNNKLNEHLKDIDDLRAKAIEVNGRIQEELKATISKGEALNESTKAD